LFFFSSRRRHTRFSRDWSSDVCSSDLAFLRRRIDVRQLLAACRDAVVMSTSVFIIVIGSLVYSGFLALNGFSDLVTQTIIGMQRSEERRVGKECSSRVQPDRSMKTRHD